MHPPDKVQAALTLADRGLNSLEISDETGINARTIRDWLAGKTPRRSRFGLGGCPECGHPAHDFGGLPTSYTYLLGMYLGDGCISESRRGVHRIRITLDLKYPDIVDECARAIGSMVPDNAVLVQKRRGRGGRVTYVEVSAYSKAWPCWFPQHGPGVKHKREIRLAEWQRIAVELNPQGLLRGLIHSDGCRFINTGRDGWRCPRYVFNNSSRDIRQLFEWACVLVNVAYTRAPKTVYVSRRADVEFFDTFIGPKS